MVNKTMERARGKYKEGDPINHNEKIIIRVYS